MAVRADLSQQGCSEATLNQNSPTALAYCDMQCWSTLPQRSLGVQRPGSCALMSWITKIRLSKSKQGQAGFHQGTSNNEVLFVSLRT